MTTILNDAERFAKTFLQDQSASVNPSRASQGRPGVVYPSQTIHHHYYNNDPWDPWFLRPRFYEPIYIGRTRSDSPSPNKPAKKKEENNYTALIVGAGIVATAIASYLFGSAAGTLARLNRQLKTLAVEKQIISPSSKLAKVIQIEEKMLQDIKQSTETGFKLNGLLAASTAMTVLGATQLLPGLAGGGLVGIGLTSSAHLVRKGFLDADTTQKEDAALLLQAVNEARAELKA